MSAPHEFFESAELELEYSPSSCVPSLDAYLTQYAELTRQARALLAPTEHAYGRRPDELIELYRPAAATEPAPVLIYIHGGYWQQLGREDSGFMAPGLAAQGIATAVIEYTLCPLTQLIGIVQQCRRAVHWVHSNAAGNGLDPNRITIAGSSAGAHLVAMCLLDPSTAATVRGGIALSGIYDLEPLVRTTVNDAVHLTLDEARRLSPQRLVRPGSPHVMVAVGRNETSEFHRQSSEFADAWRHANNACDGSAIIENRNHFDLPLDLADPTTVVGGFATTMTNGHL